MARVRPSLKAITLFIGLMIGSLIVLLAHKRDMGWNWWAAVCFFVIDIGLFVGSWARDPGYLSQQQY